MRVGLDTLYKCNLNNIIYLLEQYRSDFEAIHEKFEKTGLNENQLEVIAKLLKALLNRLENDRKKETNPEFEIIRKNLFYEVHSMIDELNKRVYNLKLKLGI